MKECPGETLALADPNSYASVEHYVQYVHIADITQSEDVSAIPDQGATWPPFEYSKTIYFTVLLPYLGDWLPSRRPSLTVNYNGVGPREAKYRAGHTKRGQAVRCNA